MTQPNEKTLDDIYNDVKSTQSRIAQADELIKQLGEGGEKVGLSITDASLEIGMLMKQLFLCSQREMAAEYELFRNQLYQHLKNIYLIVDTRFGKMASSIPDQSKETH